jgi:hypothetical protein
VYRDCTPVKILFMKMLGQVIHYSFIVVIILVTSSFSLSAADLAGDTSLPLPSLKFYVSNNGLDSNSGISESSPKKNLDSISNLLKTVTPGAGPIAVSLETNSIFREELQPVNRLQLTSFEKSSGGLRPKITGLDVVKNWTLTTGKKNVYQHLLTHSVDLNNPAYSYIIIAEIDTAIEKVNPVGGVRYLRLTSSVDACENEPGTYYSPDLRTNPVMVYIHPSTGIPEQNKFRYEATTRRFSINGYYNDEASYSNLFLQSSGNGYGMLSGGDRTLAKNIIFQGGGTHHFVIKSGTVDSCLFLPGPQGLANRIAGIFYEAEGNDNINRLSNSTFFDIPTPIYTHTNGAVNHKSLTLDKLFAFGAPGDAYQAFSSADTDSTTLTNSYAENYPTGFYVGAAKISIQNTIFRNTNQSAIQVLQPKGASTEVKISNVLIKTDGNDANQNAGNGWVAFGLRAPYSNINAEVTNSIIHGYSTWNQNSEPAIKTFELRGRLRASRNIYICDINDNNYMHIVQGDNSGGTGTSSNISSDNNVYILVRGKGFHWFVNPNNGNESSVLTLAQWQTLTGQDTHSVFIDLRNNLMGLKAVFVDPQNGNWSFASTDIAAIVKSTGAGMTNPPLYYPMRPIVNSNEAFVTPGGFSSFLGTNITPNETLLQWKTFQERDISYFAIESSLDSLNFLQLDTIRSIGGGIDTNYRFTHAHELLASNFYRLRVVRSDNSFFYSPVVGLKTRIQEGLFLEVYPNPFQNTITINHPARPNAIIGIYDLSGRLSGTIRVQAGNVKTRLPLANLSRGAYILRWMTDNESLSTLILK